MHIRDLKRATQYEICRSFTDYYHNAFHEGEILTFVGYHFLPYHGGYTIVFREKNLYLQEDENSEILNSLGSYLQPVPG